MTRARALKQLIRTRAAKTGERYTAARRNILRELTPRTPSTQSAQDIRSTRSARGGMSDASALKKTGHDLAHWFGVLDRFGAVEKGHTAAARHLHDEHKVDGWYAQGITVAYERARGVRAVNQRCDGAFEVSASKVVTARSREIVKAFTEPRQRRSWLIDADQTLARVMSTALADKASKGFVVRDDGQARFRFKWDAAVVQVYLYPRPGDKTSVTVQHTKLASADDVERYRAQWKTALGALAGYFN